MADSAPGAFLPFAPDRRIHYVDQGAGDPALVYFPANGGHVQDMHLVWPALSAEHRFVGIDPPGRQPTVWPDEPFDFFADLPRVYDRALALLRVGPHVAIGHSMGGMYALHHARRHRRLVRGLILLEGFTTLPIHYATAAPDGFRPHRMSPPVADDFRQRLAANYQWETDRPLFKRSFWPSQHFHDARPFVAELDLPILTVIAENGQKLPDTLDGWRTRLGMDRVRNLTVKVIPRAGHWMMLEYPEALIQAIREFLQSLPPAQPD